MPEVIADVEARDTDLRYTIAQMRRLYLHLLYGGSLKPADLSRMIVRLEQMDAHAGSGG